MADALIGMRSVLAPQPPGFVSAVFLWLCVKGRCLGRRERSRLPGRRGALGAGE